MGPEVMAIMALATTAIGTGFSVMSSMGAAKYNAEMAQREAVIARQKADYDIKVHREKVHRLKGKQKVSLLASGVRLSGSAIDLLADTEIQAFLDEEAIRYNAELVGWGKNAEAANYMHQGRTDALAQGVSGVASLLSSTSAAADKFGWGKSSTPSPLVSKGGKTRWHSAGAR